MLLKFNSIKDFGIFQNLDWDTTVRDKPGNNIQEFKKLNIIYARNYSGKTTLARILQCIENKIKHPDYPNSECDFLFESALRVNFNSLATCTKKVRVYNRDFVATHLNWIYDENGKIQPFSVVGQVNKEIEEQLNFLEKFLEDREQEGYFSYHLNKAEKEYQESNKQLEKLKKDMKEARAAKASQMKNDTFYGVPAVYHENHLKNDLDSFEKNYLSTYTSLNETKVYALKQLTQETNRPKISYHFLDHVSLDQILIKVKEVLARKIIPSTIIDKLTNDIPLSEWVFRGIELHKNKYDSCGFCGKTFEVDLFNKLDEHFTKEAKTLDNDLNLLNNELNNILKSIEGFISNLPKSNGFFKDFKDEYEATSKELTLELHKKTTWVNSLTKLINTKKEKFYESINQEIPQIATEENIFLRKIENLISQHNARTEAFEEAIKEAKLKLKNQALYEFISVNDLSNKRILFKKIKNELEVNTSLKEIINQNFNLLRELVAELQQKKVSQTSGIKYINQYLKNHFAADHLILKESSDGTSFTVFREEEPAKHLSEGESSLISFCYFMATLKQEVTLEDTII